jgi:hypothetical protein
MNLLLLQPMGEIHSGPAPGGGHLEGGPSGRAAPMYDIERTGDQALKWSHARAPAIGVGASNQGTPIPLIHLLLAWVTGQVISDCGEPPASLRRLDHVPSAIRWGLVPTSSIVRKTYGARSWLNGSNSPSRSWHLERHSYGIHFALLNRFIV